MTGGGLEQWNAAKRRLNLGNSYILRVRNISVFPQLLHHWKIKVIVRHGDIWNGARLSHPIDKIGLGRQNRHGNANWSPGTTPCHVGIA